MLQYDFTPLTRSFIGFDRMADLIDNASKLGQNSAYPPYNIAHFGENEYLIELAVAGFAPEDITIESKENVLTVTGKRSEPENFDGEYLHRGIAERAFERRFQLADYVVVKEAELKNGLLRIHLRRELPEAMKPRIIEIHTGSDKNLTSRKSSGKRKSA